MESIQVMMREHEQIQRVLDALDRFASGLQDRPGDKQDLRDFVSWIREYADARHHAKEEEVLFTAMVRNGFPPEQGPVGMMLLEHHQMRELVAALATLAQQDAPWSPSDLQRLSDAALSYTAQLREHIVKENEMLYPMAEEHLPARVQEQVDSECAAQDRASAEAGTDAALAELSARLVARYAP